MTSEHDPFSVDPGAETPRAPRRSRPVLRVISLSALTAGGLALGGMGLAAAADTSPSATPSSSASTSASTPTAAPSAPSAAPGAPAPEHDGPDRARGWGPGGRHGGRGHFGFGAAGGFGALHGSFVTAKPGGGYQTVDTQRGKVTAVGDASITVKSDDGFTKTYEVPADALVNAARDGLSTVKVDDEVSVVATEDGGTATALHVMDLSRMPDLRQKMAPGRDIRAPDSSSSTAPSDFEGATDA